ncbi:hypothetical protein Dimus_037734, partial [Dionaea muscipula]
MRRQLLHKLVDAFVQFFINAIVNILLANRVGILGIVVVLSFVQRNVSVSFSKWKSLEVHHIKHPVVSANDSSAAPDEEYLDNFLSRAVSPLGINVVYAESSRLFAKRQVHPFFSQWKVGKSNPENYVPESNCAMTIGKDKHFKFNPIDVLEDIK